MTSELEKRDPISLNYGKHTITVEFGDLFSQPGIKVIPVSRFMHETDVVPRSLQAKLIQKYVDAEGGSRGLAIYSSSVEAALANKEHVMKQRDEKPDSERQYPIGTLGMLKFQADQYLLLALTQSERNGHVPGNNCNLTILWTALESLWDQISGVANGENMVVPLLGTGISGIHLSHRHVLIVNILAIANAIKQNKVATIVDEIKIIMRSDKNTHKIDLSTIKDALDGLD